MAASSRTVSIPWLGFFFALCGLIWCGWIAFPTEHHAPCLTSGCALFRDGKVGGISLWWLGGACFFALALLCLRGKRRSAYALAVLALFLDALLLLVMFFTAPCMDCLIAAAFFGFTCFALRPVQEGWFGAEPGRLLLLPIWFGLFLGNIAAAGNEALPHWALANAGNTSVRLYFAPSCTHCRTALLAFGQSAALYPVAEADGDTEAIIKLEGLLLQKVPMAEALERCRNPQEPMPAIGPVDRAILSMRLLRNKAAVLKQGFQALPLIEINGMPSLPAPAAARGTPAARPETPPEPAVPGAEGPISPRARGEQPAPSTGANATIPHADPNLPLELDNLGQCGRNGAPPCD